MSIKTINEAFGYFITYTGKKQFQSLGSKKLQRVQNLFKNNISGYSLHETVPSGSYSRSVRVPGVSDIDVILILDRKTPSQLPNDVFEDIYTKLKNAVNGIDKQIRAIKFQTKDTKEPVDLIIGFGHSNGPYKIAHRVNNVNTWIAIDPRKNKQILDKLNSKHNNKVIPMIRLFKQWNARISDRSYRFKSFHLEAIIMDCFANDDKLKDINWEDLFQSIAQKLDNYIDKQIPEPAKAGLPLEVKSTKRKTVRKSVSTLNNMINRANNKKKLQEKIFYKQIFGKKFGKIHK